MRERDAGLLVADILAATGWTPTHHTHDVASATWRRSVLKTYLFSDLQRHHPAAALILAQAAVFRLLLVPGAPVW